MAYDEDLADRLREATQDEDNVTERRMFGGLAFLVNGNMAIAASSEGGLMVRVDPARSETLLAADGVARMEMGGKQMSGWLRVPGDRVAADAELRRWVDEGVGFARGLPPKQG